MGCPICKSNQYSKIDEKTIKTYDYKYNEFIIVICDSCCNIYAIKDW